MIYGTNSTTSLIIQTSDASSQFNAHPLPRHPKPPPPFNAKWKGISIAHDLTKMQCQQAKAAEMQLRKTAHEKNALLTDAEQSEKFWKVVGGRGNRQLVLVHIKQSPLA